MADYRVQTSWRTHPKRQKLERRLGRDAVLAVMDLWGFVADARPDGDLSGLDDEDIALAAQYPGEAGPFVAALTELRLLDGEPGAYRIHDLEAHNPWVAGASQRSESAARASKIRWHKRGLHASAVEGCSLCDDKPMKPKRKPKSSGSEAGAMRNDAGRMIPQSPNSNPNSDSNSDSEPNSNSDSNSESDTDSKTNTPCAPDGAVRVLPAHPPDTVTASVQVQTVWGAYREHHPRRPARLLSETREYRLIRARLDEGWTVHDLCDAIRGYHQSPFHQGENDRNRKFLSLELMMRNGDKVQAGIDFHSRGPPPAVSEREIKNHRASQQWVAMKEAKSAGD